MGWKLTVRMASTLASPIDDAGRPPVSPRRPQLSVVVPAFDEEVGLGSTVNDLERVLHERLPGGFEIIIVDDGSKDGTLEAALDAANSCQRCACKVISYPGNMGKGYALRRGFESATGGLVAFFDADGEISGSALLPLIDFIGGNVSAVVGRRRWRGARSWHRRLASILLARFSRAVFDLPVPETQAGAKVFVRAHVAQVVRQCRQNGYLFDLELMARVHREGLRMLSVDIVQSPNRACRIGLLNGIREVLPALQIWRDLGAPPPRRRSPTSPNHRAFAAARTAGEDRTS